MEYFRLLSSEVLQHIWCVFSFLLLMALSRAGAPLYSSWIFIKTVWMTTEIYDLAQDGNSGKVMEFWTP